VDWQTNVPVMNQSKTMNQDPVCGMPVDEATALYDECDGKTFYFCSYFCRHQFLATSSETSLAGKGEISRG
jgi:YHS domain-containing protein